MYKIKGISKKTGLGTVYAVYRDDSAETVKSTGVTVKASHFNLKTGKVSTKDGFHPEKNARIQAVTAAFEMVVRDIQARGLPVNQITVGVCMQAQAEELDRPPKSHSHSLDEVHKDLAAQEEEITSLEAELKSKKVRFQHYKYIMDLALPKHERHARIIIEQQQHLATLESESAEIKEYIAVLQEEAGNSRGILFTDKLEDYCNVQRLNHIKESTLGNYTVIANTVKRYDPHLKLREMNLAFFQEFQAHLIARGVTNNSIRGILSRMKGIYKYFADDLDLPTGFFTRFKMVKASKDENVLYLTPDELSELEALPLTARVHKEVRSQFMFACETGLRRSDYNITADNIQANEIVLATQKTGKQVSIPLTNKARQIFIEAGQSFRLIPESQFNQTLRIICQRMPLMDKVSMKTLTIGNKVTQKPYRKWQRMSSHVARKTFVENAVAKGVELIAIAEWLGHVDTVMLQKHYANKKQIAKREAVKLLA
jgi:site-specific recombinase XerD/uncharacterized small protein (DUF1192 family)